MHKEDVALKSKVNTWYSKVTNTVKREVHPGAAFVEKKVGHSFHPLLASTLYLHEHGRLVRMCICPSLFLSLWERNIGSMQRNKQSWQSLKEFTPEQKASWPSNGDNGESIRKQTTPWKAKINTGPHDATHPCVWAVLFTLFGVCGRNEMKDKKNSDLSRTKNQAKIVVCCTNIHTLFTRTSRHTYCTLALPVFSLLADSVLCQFYDFPPLTGRRAFVLLFLHTEYSFFWGEKIMRFFFFLRSPANITLQNAWKFSFFPIPLSFLHTKNSRVLL